MASTRTPERTPAPNPQSARAGRRAARRARERRRRIRRRVAFVLGGMLAAVGAAVATVVVLQQATAPAGAPRGGIEAVDQPLQQTLLLVRQDSGRDVAGSVTLIAASGDEAPDDEPTGFVLFLPTGTLVDIPGVGLDRLGLALQYGGPELVQSTVENALGVGIDHVASVNDAGLSAWLDRLGGLEVEVPSRLVRRRDDGSAEVRFEPGRQVLDGRGLTELWTFRERGEEELNALPRQQRVLDGLFTAIVEPGAVTTLVEGGAPQLRSSADQVWLEELLASLGAAHAAERVRFSVLPVEPFGGDGPDGGATYRLREGPTRELVEAHLTGSVPLGGGAEAVRVQVLNGVGLPGVGQEVDRRLDRGAFRIVLSDNARSFDFVRTQIIIYDESERSLAAARRVQDLLGVGTIQVSRQPQSVVDLTVVVGSDFVDDAPETFDELEDDLVTRITGAAH